MTAGTQNTGRAALAYDWLAPKLSSQERAELDVIMSALATAQAELADVTLKHQVACDTIARMKRDDAAIATEFCARELLDKGRCKAIGTLQQRLDKVEAWIERWCNELPDRAWNELAQIETAAEQNAVASDRVRSDCNEQKEGLPSAPAVATLDWQPIETAPKGRKVLAGYRNSLGNWRTITARYYLPETLDSEHTESGFADEGWYEESESIEEIMPTDCEPTHWMPLPEPPK